MDGISPFDSPKIAGAAPWTAWQPDSGLEGTARGVRKRSNEATYKRVGQVGERVLLASPASVLDAAMCRVAPELHRQPKTPHAPAADKDSERCIKRTNLLIWTI